jgi:uncharacterized protein
VVPSVIIIGVDLSGPSNVADSSLMAFRLVGDHLELTALRRGLTDEDFYLTMKNWSLQVPLVVGLDAPLSYNPNGGDRPADQELRQRLVALGLRSGTVMTPTMTKMVYLTVRGISFARLAETADPKPRIVEVHPAGTMALNGADVDSIRDMKTSSSARERLCKWLEKQGLVGVGADINLTDHDIAAAGAALAAWKWSVGQSKWLHKAEPPFHPFDFAC